VVKYYSVIEFGIALFYAFGFLDTMCV
jgi:hypothetical protein